MYTTRTFRLRQIASLPGRGHGAAGPAAATNYRLVSQGRKRPEKLRSNSLGIVTPRLHRVSLECCYPAGRLMLRARRGRIMMFRACAVEPPHSK